MPLAHLPWSKKAHLPLGFWHFCPQKLHICPGRKWHIRSRYFYLHFVHATKICNKFIIHIILFVILLLFIYFCIFMLVYMYFVFEYLNWHKFSFFSGLFFCASYTRIISSFLSLLYMWFILLDNSACINSTTCKMHMKQKSWLSALLQMLSFKSNIKSNYKTISLLPAMPFYGYRWAPWNQQLD